MSLLSPEWTALLYLVAAVCFILALKGLSSPTTARRGNAIGAAGALRRRRHRVLLSAAGKYSAHPRRHRRGLRDRRPRGPAGADDPDAPTGGALQRRRRRGRRARRGTGTWPPGGSLGPPGRRLHHAGGRGVLRRLRGDRGQAAGAHQHPSAAVSRHALGHGGRPAGGGGLRGAGGPDRVARLVARAAGSGPRRRAAPGAARRRGGRADRDLAAECLHRAGGGGVRRGAGQRPAARRRDARGRERHHPDQGHGLGHGARSRRHHVRGVQGRLDGGFHRPERPAGAFLVARRTLPSSSATPSAW